MQLHPINISEFYMQKMSLKCWYYQFGFFFIFFFIFWIVTRKLQLLHLRLKCRCYKTVLEYVCTYKFFPCQFLLFFKIRKEKKMNVLNIIGKKRNIPPKEHMENILCLEMTWLLVFLEEMQKKRWMQYPLLLLRPCFPQMGSI